MRICTCTRFMNYFFAAARDVNSAIITILNLTLTYKAISSNWVFRLRKFLLRDNSDLGYFVYDEINILSSYLHYLISVA